MDECSIFTAVVLKMAQMGQHWTKAMRNKLQELEMCQETQTLLK